MKRKKPGRPSGPTPPKTPAERKAAQRERGRVALLGVIHVPLDEMPISGLLEGLASMLAAGEAERFAEVLVEVGRRGGLAVTVGRRERT